MSSKSSTALQRPGAVKIHSHSTQFSFWTLALDDKTKTSDVVGIISNKIMIPAENVVLYEVGDNKGLRVGTLEDHQLLDVC